MAEGGLKSIVDKVRKQSKQNNIGFTPKKPIQLEYKKRDSDHINESLHKWIGQSIDTQLTMKNWLSKQLYKLLVGEIIAIFVLVILSGIKFLNLQQWLIALIFNVVILQTFGLVFVIVKNVFPSEDKILEHLNNMRVEKNNNHKTL